MPWTLKETRFLFSKGSPLSQAQKAKMAQELHDNPSLGRKRKGSKAMKRGPRT